MPSARILSRLGVRGRLLLAFFGISAFAVLGAGAALYSFQQISDAFASITQRRIPVALMSQELSRHAERIVAAAPTLLTATSQDEKEDRSVAISSEVNVLYSLLANLRSAGVESRELASLEPYVERLRDNLGELNLLINNRLMIAEQKIDLVRKELDLAGDIQKLLAPWVAVMDEKIAQWRKIVADPAVPAERRQRADREFEESLAWFRSLQHSQVVASYINDMLQQAASSDDGNSLAVTSFRLQQSLRELEKLTLELDPQLQQLMVQLIGQLRPFVSGSESISVLRKSELDLTANAARLLGENVALSKSLTTRVDQLVGGAKHDITGANIEATSVVRWSTWIVIIAVVLSLASSILIVWLYVGRNLIARLTALSDRRLIREDLSPMAIDKKSFAESGPNKSQPRTVIWQYSSISCPRDYPVLYVRTSTVVGQCRRSHHRSPQVSGHCCGDCDRPGRCRSVIRDSPAVDSAVFGRGLLG